MAGALNAGAYDFSSQSIGTDSIANARELGGYVLPDGSRVRKGLLLRGGSLNIASEEDLEALDAEYHVAKVFDFRTSMEVKSSPDKAIGKSVNIWMPAYNEEELRMEGNSLPHHAYAHLGEWLVEHAKEKMTQIVATQLYMPLVKSEFTQIQYAGFIQNIINTPEGAVYWHCSQGKDRTGFGAAIILSALGADRELIMQDFSISNDFYKDDVEYYCSLVKTEAERNVLRTFIGVNCDYFTEALDYIDRTWGSMMDFLTGPLCMSDEDFSVLRKRYLE